jgi:asparagine synthase (glutamine-hydrolysing)
VSGIVGIYNLDGQPVEPALLGMMAEALAHRGPDGLGRWIDGPVGLACQNLWVTLQSVGEVQPLVRPESVVLFDGRLDNRADLLNELEEIPGISRDSSDTALASSAYRRFGEQFAEKLNGDFAAVVYDVPERRLLLARDGIGVRPLYFSKAGESFLIASEIKPILAHPGVTAAPNADMLAAYLLACFGQERQGWTFFEGISSVLPGQLVVVTPRTFTKRIYWDFGEPQPTRVKTFPEYAEAFRHYFDQAVGRRLRSAYPVAVSVSGGVDSSSIFCAGETLRRNQKVECPKFLGVSIETTGPQSDERCFLAEIERHYACAIHRVPWSGMRFVTDSVRKAFWQMEAPYLRSVPDSDAPFFDAVRRLGARTVLFGTWGDQMLAGRAYLIDLFRRLRWIQVWRALKECARWNVDELPAFFRKDFFGALVRSYIPPTVMHFLRNSRRQLTSDRFWYTRQFWKRARRVERIQTFARFGKTAHQKALYQLVRPMYYDQVLQWCNKIAASNNCEYAYPFLDRDLISFLMAIPGDMVCATGVPKALLRSGMRGTLPAAIAERRWKSGTSQELNEAMEERFPEFTRYLDGGAMAFELGYVDERRVQEALEKLRPLIHSDGCAITWRLGDLFGSELWLQSFFGSERDIRKEKFSPYVETKA